MVERASDKPLWAAVLSESLKLLAVGMSLSVGNGFDMTALVYAVTR